MTRAGSNDFDAIDGWLETATCGLTAESASRVRDETRGHYESALAEALEQGQAAEEAHAVALAALGSAAAANRAYRKVHVTKREARMLREDAWVGRVVCSRRYLAVIPLLIVAVGVAALFLGEPGRGVVLLVGGLGMFFVIGAPMIVPINTRARGRAYRVVRWVWLIAVLWLGFAPGSWPGFVAMAGTMLWIVGWAEWRRMSIRRKLPQDAWPRSLYL